MSVVADIFYCFVYGNEYQKISLKTNFFLDKP